MKEKTYQQKFPDSGTMCSRGVPCHEQEAVLNSLKASFILDADTFKFAQRLEVNGQKGLQAGVELIRDTLHQVEEELTDTKTIFWSFFELREDQVDESGRIAHFLPDESKTFASEKLDVVGFVGSQQRQQKFVYFGYVLDEQPP